MENLEQIAIERLENTKTLDEFFSELTVAQNHAVNKFINLVHNENPQDVLDNFYYGYTRVVGDIETPVKETGNRDRIALFVEQCQPAHQLKILEALCLIESRFPVDEQSDLRLMIELLGKNFEDQS